MGCASKARWWYTFYHLPFPLLLYHFYEVTGPDRHPPRMRSGTGPQAT
jgi:hypothetical protein